MMPDAPPYIRWFEALGSDDVAVVGGKNASLGEMIQRLGASGIRVPGGFATTAQAYPRVTSWNAAVLTAEETVAALEQVA